jgi:hypothetical protein
LIRQAHTYLVGALSGVVVIGIAIAAFVVLVSAQVFHDLPIPALSSSDQKAAAVSQGKALSSPDSNAVATTGGVSTGTAQPNHTAANANAAGGGPTGTTNSSPAAGGRHHRAATPTHDVTGPAEIVEPTPSTSTPTGNTGSTSGGGKSGGSHASQPSSNSNTPTTPSSGGNSVGGNSTSSSGTSGNGGSGTSAPTTTSGSTGSGSTGGGGTTTTSPPPTPVTTAKPSEAITETVNGAVGTVDEATGGALSESGVTHVTEEVVNGVAGPESVVGKTVDGVGEVVGGLLGGNGQ